LKSALEGGEVSASGPGRSLTPGKTRYPLCTRLGGPQGRYGQVWKISFPTGFDPRAVQPVGSRYTENDTRLTAKILNVLYVLTSFKLPKICLLLLMKSFTKLDYTTDQKYRFILYRFNEF